MESAPYSGASKKVVGLLRKGQWTAREDELLTNYIRVHGEGNWNSLPTKAGLLRCGKSCRLRWLNYLRPDIKRDNFCTDEAELIMKLHSLLGNRWSLIAGRLPGRTDNQIKNYWNSNLSKKIKIQCKDTHINNLETMTNNRKKHDRDNTSRNYKLVDGNNHGSNNKLKIRESCKKDVEGERVRVFKPKPIRIRHSFDIGSTSNNTRRGEILEFTENSTINVDNEDCLYNLGIVQGLLGIDHEEYSDDHNYNNEMTTASLTNVDDMKSLEKVYEEYMQLLETKDLDS